MAEAQYSGSTMVNRNGVESIVLTEKLVQTLSFMLQLLSYMSSRRKKEELMIIFTN